MALSRVTVKGRHAAQVAVVGVQAFRRLALDSFDFRLFQLRPYRTHHARGHLVLQIEDIFNLAVETINPQVGTGRGIDELARNAHAVARLTYAAFENVAHPELASHLFYVDGPALVGEARIAGDHEQLPETRQRGDDLFHYTVGEIFLLRIPAHILKR